MVEPVDPLQRLPFGARGPLLDHLSRLRHDLGKYVSLQVRWLGASPPPEALRQAMMADLLETHRGPGGGIDAPTVWAGLRPALVGEVPLDDTITVDLSGDVDFERLDDAMARISGVVRDLRGGVDGPQTVATGIEAARTVSDACRALWSRLRGG
ncbi:MAG TPA: hypothetical protein ENK18_19000 [Deltaproteobacteria bacterium]|nr:hypothetical protein [Deltaproteobacteria bacterium]